MSNLTEAALRPCRGRSKSTGKMRLQKAPIVAVVCLAVMVGPACSRAEQKAKQTTASYSLAAEVDSLFASDPNIKKLAIPRGEGAAKVCATPEALMALYPGRGVVAVTGAGPFAPLGAPNDVCSVKITQRPSPGHNVFVAPTCSVRAVSGNKVEIVVPETFELPQLEWPNNDFTASECFYRLALVLEGYTGGFTTPVFGTFPDSAYFIGRRRYVGPIVAPVVRTLWWRCPEILNHYYKPSLKQDVTKECLKKIEGN